MMTAPRDMRDDARTTLDKDKKKGLIPSYITLRSELNEAEQANILETEEWAFKRIRDVLSAAFLDDLHKRMFGAVWKWAGIHRQTDKNIGIDFYRINDELGQIIGDCLYWIEHETYRPDEIAARFHHKLVWIHCYPNGNGRHARLVTDLLLKLLGRDGFSWGRVSLVNPGETREKYVAALRAADNHDINPLLDFVRS